MAEPRSAEPVKLFVGMLSAFADALDAAELELAAQWGAVDLKSAPLSHEFTDYYRREMGGPLLRGFVAFNRLVDPADLAGIKCGTNAIERQLAATGRWPVARPVNLDPGYVTPAKLVLVSCKDYAHRVYLGDGVYAEATLSYTGGRWQAHPWTYPDYRTAEYHAFFTLLRERLLADRKEARCS